MYQVFKQIWDKVHSKKSLQFVAEYPKIETAQDLARRVKGVVKINGTICLDLR